MLVFTLDHVYHGIGYRVVHHLVMADWPVLCLLTSEIAGHLSDQDS